MDPKASAVRSWAWISSGIVTAVLVFPLLPQEVIAALREGEEESGIALAAFALLVVVVLFLVGTLAPWVEALLARSGLLPAFDLKHCPVWLREAGLRRIEETLRVQRDQVEEDEAGSEELFAVMVAVVGERSRAGSTGELKARLFLYRMLFTLLGLAALTYPFLQPVALTERLDFGLGQRLVIAAACAVLALASLVRMRADRRALRGEVISRFVAEGEHPSAGHQLLSGTAR